MAQLSSWAKRLLILLAVISVILNIVFICLLSLPRVGQPECENSQALWKYDHTDQGEIFAELSKAEYHKVRNYMWAQKSLDITGRSTFASPELNYIYLIELALPKKADALRYLDDHGPKPVREASVVVFHGSAGYIKEYVVGPLDGQLRHRDVTKEKYNQTELKITARPFIIGEFVELSKFTKREVFDKLKEILKESFGHTEENPLMPFESMPPGLKSGDRQTWISYSRPMSGKYLHPVSFEVLVDHQSIYVSQWRLQKLFYNGKYFNTVDEFKESYINGNVTKIVYKDITYIYASIKPRSKPKGFGPHQTYPQGKRFSVKGNQVMYLDWSFAFGLSTLTGMRAFDIRLKGERIVYELSVQEAMSIYGSATPAMSLIKFIDSSFGIGQFAYELVRGVDCPYGATYVDTYRYIDTHETRRFRNSICVFEHDMGRPLRRHFSEFFHLKYGGLANSALVMRTVTAIGNYDYVWDFIFYQSGTIEARVHATGYILSSYFIDGSSRYGHQVAENTQGNIHTHFINFKVDLDILGVKNVFQTRDMAFEEADLPWAPGRKAKTPVLVEKQLNTEQEAALRHDKGTPRYLHVASNRTNSFGQQRSYRIQVISFAPEHLPESEPEERAVSWARYKVAITKHKDLEQTSNSLYSQCDIWSPAIDFSKFIADNESIVNEDLVAWVTTGFLHIPHAEDIPNTVTVGNGGSVILRPHNYFDEDPSINSPDGVYFEPGSEYSCEYNKMACLGDEYCPPALDSFSYSGFDHESG